MAELSRLSSNIDYLLGNEVCFSWVTSPKSILNKILGVQSSIWSTAAVMHLARRNIIAGVSLVTPACLACRNILANPNHPKILAPFSLSTRSLAYSMFTINLHAVHNGPCVFRAVL